MAMSADFGLHLPERWMDSVKVDMCVLTIEETWNRRKCKRNTYCADSNAAGKEQELSYE